MKNNYTIGEIANIFNISSQSLRYYDRINLFKPNDRDYYNNYRYYSKSQFQELRTILYLKSTGISLEDIKRYKENKDIKYLIAILERQEKLIKYRIKELEAIKTSIDSQLKELENSMEVGIHNTIDFKNLDERYVYSLEEDYSIEELPEKIYKILQEIFKEKSKYPHLVSNKLGISIDKENLLIRKFDKYSYISMFQQDLEYKDIVNVIPKGTYACIYHKGAYKKINETYNYLLDELAKRKVKIGGDSLEIASIDIKLTDNPNEYFTQIQIPIIID